MGHDSLGPSRRMSSAHSGGAVTQPEEEGRATEAGLDAQGPT